MECRYCEKNNKCPIQKTFTEEEIGCSKGVLTIKAQKELNAFQIIKEKRVDVVYLVSACYDLEDYNDYPPFEISEEDKLTQEEYDLLKEVLL